MPIVTTRSHYLSINGVSMATPAWDVLNLHVLWQMPAVRGTDLIIPGASGARPRRRWAQPTKYTLELIIHGNVNPDGTAYSDHFVGLQSNIAYLRTNVADPVATESGTRTATLTMPDATVRSGHLHVETFEIAPISYKHVRATMDVSLPMGVLS